MDQKLARGMARQIGRELERTGGPARRDSFLFAMGLLCRNGSGRRIDGPAFNVPLARLVKAARDNPATLRVEFERLRLGKPGVLHRQSLKREDVRHFRDGSEFVAREWSVAIDHIRVERGRVSFWFWTPPILFDHHFVERYIERGGVARGERIAALVDGGLALASLYRACAARLEERTYETLDIALPAPGGAVLGGVELIECPSFGERFYSAVSEGEHVLQFFEIPLTLHVAASLRTFMDDALLDPEQQEAVAEVRRWAEAHDHELRRDPLAAFAWGDDEGIREIDPGLVESFRPICEMVQERFDGWRRRLFAEGYREVDFEALFRRFVREPPDGGKIDPELLLRHMHYDLRSR